MTSTVDSPSLNSSMISSHYDSNEDAGVNSIKNYVKELLKARIFLGRYMERRLVDESIGYRDIVVISAAEVEIKKDLLEAQQKIRTACPKLPWIGITDTEMLGYSPPGLCLWSEIDNQPFGLIWFQVKTVQFRNNEVIVRLKCLRHISEAFLEAEPILTGADKPKKRKANNESTTGELEVAYSDIKDSLKSALTITNVKEFFTFLFAFIIAIFTGSTAFINFLGNFVLALIRETSNLVHNSTPWFLGLLEFLSKIVGGFYILMAMIFRPSPQPVNQRRRRISYEPIRVDPYNDRCFD